MWITILRIFSTYESLKEIILKALLSNKKSFIILILMAYWKQVEVFV